MLIKLKDINGRVINVAEVDDESAEWYVEQERIEENADRRYRYWVKASLDSVQYEGEWFSDTTSSPVEECNRNEEKINLQAFMATLTETQRRRLEILMDNTKISLREIARREGVNYKQIQKSFKQIEKKWDLKKHDFSPYSEGGN